MWLLPLAAAWAAMCSRFLVEVRADERHRVTTDDGWRIALHRYRPAAPTRRHPVLLCHGLGANRVTWDLAPEVSFARHLAGLGFDVWVIELRGHGDSDRAGLFEGRRFAWTFDDYLLLDIPAAIRHITAATGSPAVHWVGHSMGGLLLYAHLARGGSVRSGVTIGSSLDYSASRSGFKKMLGLRGLGRWLERFPVGTLLYLYAPLSGWVRNGLDDFDHWLPNVDGRLVRRLNASAFHDISTGVLEQLASAFDEGGLTSADGSRRYLPGLASATAPVLAVAGDRDFQCPPDAARVTLDALGSAAKRLVVCGREAGHPEHYGHFDLLIGKRARAEVWPALTGWLEEHDGDLAAVA